MLSAGTQSEHVTSGATSWQDLAISRVAKFLNTLNSRQRLETWPTGGRSDQAQSIGADAVVMIRYTTSMIASGASEILADGTAVKLS